MNNDAGFDEAYAGNGEKDLDYWFKRFSAISEDLAILDETGNRIETGETTSVRPDTNNAPPLLINRTRESEPHDLYGRQKAISGHADEQDHDEAADPQSSAPSSADSGVKQTGGHAFFRIIPALLGLSGLAWFIRHRIKRN